MMTYTTVESSMIDLVGYDEETSTLEARFVNTGYTYRYENVPKEEYEGFFQRELFSRNYRMLFWI